MFLAAILKGKSPRAVRTQCCGREAGEEGVAPGQLDKLQEVINLPHLGERINKGSFLRVPVCRSN